MSRRAGVRASGDRHEEASFRSLPRILFFASFALLSERASGRFHSPNRKGRQGRNDPDSGMLSVQTCDCIDADLLEGQTPS